MTGGTEQGAMTDHEGMSEHGGMTGNGGERSGDELLGPVAARGAFGGALMGLANLVPGISGGTMLLAAGVYPRFIEAVGEVTTFRFRKESLVTLGAVIVAAGVAVAGLAGPVKDLVVHQRWVMYSIFIGLTLGGVPVLWRLVGRPTPAVWTGAATGFVGMGLLALTQASGTGGGLGEGGPGVMFVAGVAGASAMILPGVSGGYLLLLLGAYVPLLAGIERFVGALGVRDPATALDVGLRVLMPVGLGVAVGIAGVSNLLRWLLHRHEKATYGVLLGLLFGAVLGLWPFQRGVAPPPGTVLAGRTVTRDLEGLPVFEASGEPVEEEDWPTVYFRPTAGQAVGALALVTVSFLATGLIDRLGRQDR